MKEASVIAHLTWIRMTEKTASPEIDPPWRGTLSFASGRGADERLNAFFAALNLF
jgi:hypothetical protein